VGCAYEKSEHEIGDHQCAWAQLYRDLKNTNVINRRRFNCTKAEHIVVSCMACLEKMHAWIH